MFRGKMEGVLLTGSSAPLPTRLVPAAPAPQQSISLES